MVVQVTNRTRATIIAAQCEVARTFWARGMGLMGRPDLARGQGLLIVPEWSIHTFFMRFAIDVLFVDREWRVVHLREAMPPNRPYAGAWGAYGVVELPAGQIAASQTMVGDLLVIDPPL
jgi:uncharacterized protein